MKAAFAEVGAAGLHVAVHRAERRLGADDIDADELDERGCEHETQRAEVAQHPLDEGSSGSCAFDVDEVAAGRLGSSITVTTDGGEASDEVAIQPLRNVRPTAGGVSPRQTSR